MSDSDTPIYEAAQDKPEPYTAVRLFFADGRSQGGIWTGKVWWSEGQAVFPERWQRLRAREGQGKAGG